MKVQHRVMSQERVILVSVALVIAIILLFSTLFMMTVNTNTTSSIVTSAPGIHSNYDYHHLERNIRRPHLFKPRHNNERNSSSILSSITSGDEQTTNLRHRYPHPRVAVAALLTSNSKRGEQIHRAVDGLAVLRRSMLEVLPLEDQLHFTFVAMLTDSVDAKWENILKNKLGWTAIKRYHKPPVDPSEIRNPQIAKEIVTDGAIGIDELTKLRVFEWGDEFDIVILLDADILLHKPFPELYRDVTGVSLRWTKGGWAIEKINGGFLVIEPKGEVGKRYFSEMMDVIREGDFRPGTGWRGSGIGWTYGGRTVQGVLPYYFLHYLRVSTTMITKRENNNVSSSTSGKDDLQIDRCRYNNMDQLPECKQKPLEEITSNHFTGDCVKPWWCGARSARCAGWSRKWKEVYARELRAQGKGEIARKIVSGGADACEFESLAKMLYEK